MRNIGKFTIGLGITAALSLLVACAGQPETKHADFDKWKELAKKSRGYSPASRQRTIDPPPKKIKIIAPGQTETSPARPLPQRKIAMKMHQTVVAVLLRALARSVDLNIMINDVFHFYFQHN